MNWSPLKVIPLLMIAAVSTMLAGPAPAEDLNREGWRLYRMGEFDSAIENFRSLRTSAQTGSKAEIEGLYGEASCWNFRRDRRDTVRAIHLYDQILRNAPESPLAAWAALDRVRARYLGAVDFERNAEIAQAFTEVAESHEGTPAGEEAFLLAMNQQISGMNPEKAAQLHVEIDVYLRRHPKSLFLSRLSLLQAECCGVLDRQAERLEKMILALQTREYDEMSPQADNALSYWQIAYIAEFQAGNFLMAREYYRRLIKEYPRDIRVFGARQALDRMDAVEAAIRTGQPIPPQWEAPAQP